MIIRILGCVPTCSVLLVHPLHRCGTTDTLTQGPHNSLGTTKLLLALLSTITTWTSTSGESVAGETCLWRRGIDGIVLTRAARNHLLWESGSISMSLCGGLTKPGDRVDDRALDLLLQSLRQLLGSGGGWSHQANWDKRIQGKCLKKWRKIQNWSFGPETLWFVFWLNLENWFDGPRKSLWVIVAGALSIPNWLVILASFVLYVGSWRAMSKAAKVLNWMYHSPLCLVCVTSAAEEDARWENRCPHCPGRAGSGAWGEKIILTQLHMWV